jgi:hypothetical protein
MRVLIFTFLTSLQRTGVYLSHAPARSIPHGVDTKWIAAAADLAKQGWGLGPIYVGAEPAGSSTVPPPDNPLGNAQIDATEAISLAQRAGLEPGKTIFLDVEKAFPAGSLRVVCAQVAGSRPRRWIQNSALLFSRPNTLVCRQRHQDLDCTLEQKHGNEEPADGHHQLERSDTTASGRPNRYRCNRERKVVFIVMPPN